MKQFNVLLWDINKRELTTYDVLPYFRKRYKDLKKKDRPSTKEQWTEFVRIEGMYMYWSRCEYDIIISDWPSKTKEFKIDVWQQIENNLDLVVDILMSEVK